MARRRTLHTPKPGWNTISDLPGNCVPTAFKLVSGLPDKTVFDAAFQAGFESTGGMFQHNWVGMFRTLNLQTEKLEAADLRTTGLSNDGFSSQRMTLAAFCRTYNKGVFFVGVAQHALVVQDGAVVDPNWGSKIGGRRRVHLAWKVLNSPLKHVSVDKPKGKRLTKSMTFEAIRIFSVYRYGTKHYYGYKSLWEVLGKKPVGFRFTLADLERCDYTRAQLNYDIKRGNVRIVE